MGMRNLGDRGTAIAALVVLASCGAIAAGISAGNAWAAACVPAACAVIYLQRNRDNDVASTTAASDTEVVRYTLLDCRLDVCTNGHSLLIAVDAELCLCERADGTLWMNPGGRQPALVMPANSGAVAQLRDVLHGHVSAMRYSATGGARQQLASELLLYTESTADGAPHHNS